MQELYQSRSSCTAFYNASCKAYVYATAFCDTLYKVLVFGFTAVSPKGKKTRIWSLGCSFDCVTTMGCAGFKLLFGIIIFFFFFF